MVINTSGNVGIGTTSPSSKLDVAGTIKATSFSLNNETITSWPSGGEGSLWTELNSNVYRPSGNVGIGTATPESIFHIVKNGNYSTLTSGPFGGGRTVVVQALEPAFTLSSDMNGAGMHTGTEAAVGGMSFTHRGSSDYNNLRIGTRIGGGLYFVTSNADRMAINTSGNVGIGTTSPAAKLDVAGTVKATSFVGDGSGLTGISGGGLWTESGGDVYRASGNVGIGTSPDADMNLHVKNAGGSTAQIKLENPTDNQVRFWMKSPSYSWAHGVLMSNGGSYSISNSATGDIGSDAKLTIKQDGKVGIGTTGPSAKLDVLHDSSFVLRLARTNNAPHVKFENTGQAGKHAVIFGQNDLFSIQRRAADNSIEAIWLYGLSNGNVGIGTATPTARLQVQTPGASPFESGLRIYNPYGQSGGSAALLFKSEWTDGPGQADRYWKAGIAYEDAGTYGRGNLHFLLEDQADYGAADLTDSKMMISYAGNVGIGTATPGARLEVNGGDFILDNTDGGLMAFKNSGTAYGYIGNAADLISGASNTDLAIRANVGKNLHFSIDNIAKMTLSNNGNFGVGTTAPANLLHVVGGEHQGITVSGSQTPRINLDANDASDGHAGLWFMQQGTNMWEMRRYASSYNTASLQNAFEIFQLRNKSGSEINRSRLVIDDYGKVGIGTTSPDQFLTVNGDASKPGGGSWATFSDERLKDIKGAFDSGLDEVLRLSPVRYRYSKDNPLGIRDQGVHVGLSAQEVEKVIPEAVSTGSKGYRLVNNDPIVWAMLNAIKEQQREIKSLREEIEELKSER
ncbi:MAG: tail fiber domain-containing protein [Elusimicrobiota bacterium]